MTLEQASTATGVSRAALSKIERGEMSPTYDSLCKLARGLRVDLAALVAGQPQIAGGVVVTRADDGAATQRTAHYAHRMMAPEFADRALYVFETEVRATSPDGFGEWDSHESEDFLYVLEGAVSVHLEGRTAITLATGDALQMDGRIPHVLVRQPTGSGDASIARILWASVPFKR